LLYNYDMSARSVDGDDHVRGETGLSCCLESSGRADAFAIGAADQQYSHMKVVDAHKLEQPAAVAACEEQVRIHWLILSFVSDSPFPSQNNVLSVGETCEEDTCSEDGREGLHVVVEERERWRGRASLGVRC
jgi:hypothetical protein